ncbi:MAG: 30S ribosomal protein S9 [Planctomycetota bacterium]|jgi:small subunit ribosomal protein S9
MTETQNESPLIDPNLVPDAPVAAPVPVVTAKPAKPDMGGFIWGTGRRKSSVARVRVKPGKGELKINNREVGEYFSQEQDREAVTSPLKDTNTLGSLDVFVNVKGGGTTGQAGATMLGIARALKNYDPTLMKQLRDSGYLTRDSRMVERKKPGKPGARKSFQFSKR